jgi:hypothetical protein
MRGTYSNGSKTLVIRTINNVKVPEEHRKIVSDAREKVADLIHSKGIKVARVMSTKYELSLVGVSTPRAHSPQKNKAAITDFETALKDLNIGDVSVEKKTGVPLYTITIRYA